MSEEIKKEIDKYIESISAFTGVLQIYLFGSHANGDPKDNSDVDLMVIVENNMDPFRTAFKIRRSLVGSDIMFDIVVNKKDAFEKASREQPFQKSIKENGVVLYAQ